jgi:hypothetical protein
MEHQPLTFKAINRSPDSFYRHVYPVLKMKKDELIDLETLYSNKKIVIVDSCGWVYQTMFPNSDIYKIEGIDMCKNVSMTQEKLDCLFDDRDFKNQKFPNRPFDGSVLIIDHSPLMKYRNGKQIRKIFNDLAQSIRPELFHIRMLLDTTDDYRFDNRILELVNIVPDNYVTTEFLFFLDVGNRKLVAKFKRLKNYAPDFN